MTRRPRGITRREFLKLTGAATVLAATGRFPLRVFAQGGGSFQIVSHAVHETVARTGAGGDIVAPWMAEMGVANIEWRTAGIPQVHETLFREATLNQTALDVGYILNTHLFPRIATLFDPLDDYLAAGGIEDLDDFFPGMMESLTIDGRLYGIPVRHSTSGLHWNQRYFDERGVAGPPSTIEEMAEIARELTFTRDDGQPVYGFVLPGSGQMHANTTDIARAWNGDFITTDYEVVCNQPPMIKALTMLREMFADGVLPSALISIANTDLDTWMQTGRAAMCVGGMGRNRIYNDAEASQFPGEIQTMAIPVSEELVGQFEVAPIKTEYWSMVIPRPAQQKELSWSFIEALSTKEAHLAMALNGNGPTRASTYDEPAFNADLPYAEAEKQALAVARVPLPAFDRSAEAADVITEHVQAVILGAQPAQRAMDDLARRLEALLRA
jgi:multiple sugar transport system substrate-binding protein